MHAIWIGILGVSAVAAFVWKRFHRYQKNKVIAQRIVQSLAHHHSRRNVTKHHVRSLLLNRKRTERNDVLYRDGW